MAYVNAQDILSTFGGEVVRKAKLELGVTKTRVGIRATWTKDGQPISHRKRNYKGRINASGDLSKSLSYKFVWVKGQMVVRFYMESYGIYVDQGRKPGKFAPVKNIEQWTKVKGLRPRNLKSGQFIANSSSNRSAMSFMINRKLKYFGTEPTEFFTKPLDEMLKTLPEAMQDALVKDILIEFNDL